MLPVNLGQVLLTLALVHISQPIVRLDDGKDTCRTETVNQQQQTVVVVGLMRPAQPEIDLRNMRNMLVALLATRDGKQHDNSKESG